MVRLLRILQILFNFIPNFLKVRLHSPFLLQFKSQAQE